MKSRSLAVLAAIGFISFASFIVDAQIRIMPFGDSVTSRGAAPESTYRFWLYSDLTNAGYQFDNGSGTLTFIGDASGAQDGTPANSWPDEEYEGGDGWTTSTGIGDINTVNSQSPDIVLLDLGANDYNSGIPVKTNLADVQTNLEIIIQGLAAQNPNIVVVLARPTGWELTPDASPGTKQFMTGLGSAVSKAASNQKRAGVDVVTVNLYGGFDPTTDTVDGTHPNIKGEQQIAKKYFNALRPILRKMGIIPQKPPRHPPVT